MFSLSRFIRSFRYAFHGIRQTVATEQNFQAQLFFGACALLLAWVLALPLTHVALLILVTTFVLVLELVNTAWERTLDLVHPGLSPAVRAIKDVLAAFVFIASLGAFFIGMILLGPPLIDHIAPFFYV